MFAVEHDIGAISWQGSLYGFPPYVREGTAVEALLHGELFLLVFLNPCCGFAGLEIYDPEGPLRLGGILAEGEAGRSLCCASPSEAARHLLERVGRN